MKSMANKIPAIVMYSVHLFDSSTLIAFISACSIFKIATISSDGILGLSAKEPLSSGDISPRTDDVCSSRSTICTFFAELAPEDSLNVGGGGECDSGRSPHASIKFTAGIARYFFVRSQFFLQVSSEWFYQTEDAIVKVEDLSLNGLHECLSSKRR